MDMYFEGVLLNEMSDMEINTMWWTLKQTKLTDTNRWVGAGLGVGWHGTGVWDKFPGISKSWDVIYDTMTMINIVCVFASGYHSKS